MKLSLSLTGIALVAALAACGGGGSGGGPSPLPPGGGATPTPTPTSQSLSCAGTSAPTGTVANALYGCVRALGGPNAYESPPAGITVPAGWADAAVATQDQGPVAQRMYVYAGGVYHDPLRAPTGSVSTTTNADGSFSLPMSSVNAALAQSATYYGYPGYALIEVSPVALASPCGAVPDAVANPAMPNDYPTVACGGTQPAPMPSPVANQDATYTNLFPYTGASSQEVAGFSVSQTTGTGWLADMPIYITQLSGDEAIMFDGAQGIRNANECLWLGGTAPGQDTCGAAIPWDNTPLIPDELAQEFARYQDMLWQAYGQGDTLTRYTTTGTPVVFSALFNGAAGTSESTGVALTANPPPSPAENATYIGVPCVPPDPGTAAECFVRANIGFLAGFAVAYNGVAPSYLPNIGTSDYFQEYGWSPR